MHHSLHGGTVGSADLDGGFFESIKSDMDPWADLTRGSERKSQKRDASVGPPPLPNIGPMLTSAAIDDGLRKEPIALPDPPYHPIRITAQTVLTRWGQMYIETMDCGPVLSKFRVSVRTESGDTWFLDSVYTDLLDEDGKPIDLAQLSERFEALQEDTRRSTLRKGVDGLDGFTKLGTLGLET